MVGHAFRRLGAARRVEQLIDDGALGRVVLAEANMSLPGSLKPEAWRAHRERNPGGPIMQLGIHHVDTLSYWLGPVARASGRFAHVETGADIDDVGVVTLEFESGALGSLTGSTCRRRCSRSGCSGATACSTTGPISAGRPRAPGRGLDAHGRRRADPVRAARHARRGARGVRRRIRGKAELETGADEGIAALAAVLQALEANAEAVS